MLLSFACLLWHMQLIGGNNSFISSAQDSLTLTVTAQLSGTHKSNKSNSAIKFGGAVESPENMQGRKRHGAKCPAQTGQPSERKHL